MAKRDKNGRFKRDAEQPPELDAAADDREPSDEEIDALIDRAERRECVQKRRDERDQREADLYARAMASFDQQEATIEKVGAVLQAVHKRQEKRVIEGLDADGRPVLLVVSAVERATIEGSVVRVGMESGREVVVSAESIGMDSTPDLGELREVLFGDATDVPTAADFDVA